MTNSIPEDGAEAVLKTLLERLSEKHLAEVIDAPIYEALENFDLDFDASFTYQGFIRMIGAFVQHVYQHGLLLKQELTEQQARGEAIALLERGYQSLGAQGFDAALLDATRPNQDNFSSILAQLADVIRLTQREQYKRWVAASFLHTSGWRQRCRIAEVLLKNFRTFLPDDILNSRLAELAPHIPDLIAAHLNPENILHQAIADSGISKAN
ncbi:MAG: hypothetical protein ABIH23_26910 [bacterium]